MKVIDFRWYMPFPGMQVKNAFLPYLILLSSGKATPGSLKLNQITAELISLVFFETTPLMFPGLCSLKMWAY